MVTEPVPVDSGSTNPTGTVSETATSTSLPSVQPGFAASGPATTTEQAPTYSPTDVMNYLRGMNGKIENIVTEMQSIRTTVTTQGGPRLDNLEVLQGRSSPTPAAFESWLQAPPSKATGPSLQPGVPVHSVAPTSQHAEGSSSKVYPQPPKVQKELSSPP